jgi:hypothetical protein
MQIQKANEAPRGASFQQLLLREDYAKRAAGRSFRIPPIATSPRPNSARVGAIGVFFGDGGALLGEKVCVPFLPRSLPRVRGRAGEGATYAKHGV